MTRSKSKTSSGKKQPVWVGTLRDLMAVAGLNPRSLSLKAGLNPTAVRDMLEGRTRSPRYDTAEALAKALGTTATHLMKGETDESSMDDLCLLAEIIACLQEISEDMDHALSPREFAAMAATIYHRLQDEEKKSGASSSKQNIGAKIYDLLDYEKLRKQGGRR